MLVEFVASFATPVVAAGNAGGTLSIGGAMILVLLTYGGGNDAWMRGAAEVSNVLVEEAVGNEENATAPIVAKAICQAHHFVVARPHVTATRPTGSNEHAEDERWVTAYGRSRCAKSTSAGWQGESPPKRCAWLRHE